VRLNASGKTTLTVPEGHTTSIFVLRGRVLTAEGKSIGEAEIAAFEREGTELHLEAKESTTLLFLGGEPLHEPIVGYGPFVMNTPEEIREAFEDYENGKMGVIERIEGAE
jgi:redox-sensitive bicupin YhaK (pirin superfamily)